MKKILYCKKTVFLSVVIFGFLSFFTVLKVNSEIFENNQKELVLSLKNKEDAEVVRQSDIFFREDLFYPAIRKAESVVARSDMDSIIVPHHLVASDFIAEMIKMASGRDIKKVVVIGPNHNNVGTSAITTLKADWDTPFGLVEYDSFLVDSFFSDLGVYSGMEIFENEHSIGGIMPFIKYYLKEAKIIPLVVSSYATQSDIDGLEKWLDDNLDKNTLLIYSIDFSHYLSKSQADRNDGMTKEFILNGDVGEILRLNNDFVDSPQILALSLMRAKNNNLETNIRKISNSFDFTSVNPQETTSYFAVGFSY